jgi:hypothetical protein
MKKYTISSIFLFLCINVFFVQSALAQIPLNTQWNKMVLPKSVSPQTYTKLAQTTQKAFEQYQSYARLQDESSNKVTQKSINLFKPLFASNSKILEDYVPNATRIISVNDYVATGLRNFPKQGLTQEFLEAKINRVAYDSAGYYNVIVDAVKKMYIQLDNGVPSSTLQGYKVECQLFYQIRKDSLNKAFITRIQAGGDWLHEDPTDILLTPYARYGLNNFALQNPVSPFSITSPFDLGVGLRLDYITPKGILLGAALQLNQQKFSFVQSGKSYKYKVEGLTNTELEKTVDYKENKGDWTIKSLSVPIYLGYRVWKSENQKLRLHTRLSFVPTITQSAVENHAESSVTYIGNYTIKDDLTKTKIATFVIDYEIPNEAEYHYGTYKVAAQEGIALKTQLGVAVGIEPELQYSFSSALRMSLGLSYIYGVLSPFKGDKLDLFKNNETNDNKSLIQTSVSSVNYQSFGICLGISYKLNWNKQIYIKPN